MIKKMQKGILCLGALCLSTSVMADWPVALTDSFAVHPEESSISIGVLSNDIGTGLLIVEVNEWTEKGGKANLGYLSTTQSKRGHINVSYSPPDNFAGEDTFWYVIEDQEGRRNAAKVTVTVKPEDSRFPNPINDSFSVQQDKTTRLDVTKNDIYRFGDSNITKYNEWSKEGGQIAIDQPIYGGRPQLFYTPPTGFTGTDTFWYAINTRKNFDTDEYVEHAAMVTVNVSAGNKSGPYPYTKEDYFSAQTLCVRGYCPRGGTFHVTVNDVGQNLKLSTSSQYSLNGGTVKAIQSSKAATAMLSYTPSSLAAEIGEDKVWYSIEDEIGRTNWGVVNIKITSDYQVPYL